jgi:hypothetical protein
MRGKEGRRNASPRRGFLLNLELKRHRREEAIKNGKRRSVILDRKSPSFAKGAHDGAPSSFWVRGGTVRNPTELRSWDTARRRRNGVQGIA